MVEVKRELMPRPAKAARRSEVERGSSRRGGEREAVMSLQKGQDWLRTWTGRVGQSKESRITELFDSCSWQDGDVISLRCVTTYTEGAKAKYTRFRKGKNCSKIVVLNRPITQGEYKACVYMFLVAPVYTHGQMLSRGPMDQGLKGRSLHLVI